MATTTTGAAAERPAAVQPPPLRAFVVTVDTEGDDLWSRPRDITTRNAAFLPRFQALCEDFGFAPTWLVNHEMACCPVFQRFGQQVLRRGTGEIGMHLHAWNSPPVVPLTDDDFHHQPYLIEYPEDLMEAKIDHLAGLLRSRFDSPVTSHRAGRWAFDARYARLLHRHGFEVDCSVTPGVDWRAARGAPQGRGGIDYRGFPRDPYRMDAQRIDRPGRGGLLQVPVSVLRSRLHRWAPWAYRVPGLRGRAWRHRPDRQWLYPDGRNLVSMREVVDEARAAGRPVLEMVLHSSELMPAGSPNGRDEAAIEALYRDLRVLFAQVAQAGFQGMTLGNLARRAGSA
ncbi:MAG: deacetylase [Rubrivivax sp.]